MIPIVLYFIIGEYLNKEIKKNKMALSFCHSVFPTKIRSWVLSS